MVDFTALGQMATIGTAVGTLALVTLFWLAIKQMEESNKLSKVQLQHRFRPWIGPSSGIELMNTTDGKHQFSVYLKNYGELPSTNVVAYFSTRNEIQTRDAAKKSDGKNSFNLGPLLPNMEKRYWFFIESDLIEKAKSGTAEIFVSLYFSYEYQDGKSGYGMISQFDSKTTSFLHTDMWAD